MKLDVHISGLDALSLKVRYLTEAARVGLKLSTSEAAFLFVTEAKDLVPVLSGRLRDAIHQEHVTDEPERQVWNVQPFYETTANEYGMDPPYARRIELGFMGTDKLGRVYHQPAQPYMRPAHDNKADEARETIRAGVYDQLDAAMNRRAA